MKLQNMTPWPDTKPEGSPMDHGWLAEGTRRVLERHLRADMKLVVELGVWLGRSTHFLLDQCPDATVISVDLWDAEHLGQWADAKHPHLSEVARRPLKTFMVNLWDRRDRVVPMQMDSVEAIKNLAASGVKPDLIYLDTSHQHPHTLHEIRAIKAAFPDVQLVGDDWLYVGRRRRKMVQMSVNQFVSENSEWAVESDGNGWALVPA